MGKRKFSFSKKCIGMIIAIALLLSVTITPMAASPTADLNGDNSVSAPDLVTLRTVLLIGKTDNDCDVNGDGVIDILDLVRLKKILAQVKTEVTVPVKSVDGKVSEGGVTLATGGVSAVVPTGVLLEEGVNSLTLTVIPLTSTGIPAAENEKVTSYDVHISGISKENTVPVIIELGAVMPKYLNMGNYKIYHVENGENKLMTLVASREDLKAHNRFTYEPETGKVTVAMATFSEVALVSAKAVWKGEFDYSWYDADSTDLTIANADQLAAFGAIVGGMNGQTQDSFAGKTVKLLADIDLGGSEVENVDDNILYPIGYYNTEGTYEKTGTDIDSAFKTFEGTFDGNGHTISNIYQNTWEMKGDNEYYPATEQRYRDGMGLFGKVYGGTVKNLSVDNFKSDGEYTTTGVIAAYADFGATFENIAITNCNPRVYNIGNGGIVGCVGWYTKGETANKVTFKTITVDNSNKISALWGSWDVACGGIVGQYYPTSGQTSAGSPKNAGVHFENCHVAAQIDVYNDVCANYQYYAYRYAGMMIGSIRENETIDGHVYPKMDGITAERCTVHYDTWNDYFYCELVANSLASYTHDHQFSRLVRVANVDGTTITPLEGETFTVPASGRYNFVVTGEGEFATENATCYHFVDGAVWNHTDAGTETVSGVEVLKENNQHLYLPFAQLFTGYGWGVTSKGISDFNGIDTMDITSSEQKDSAPKFDSKIDGDLLYRVADGDTSYVGTLFKAKEDSAVAINGSSVHVTVEKVNDDDEVSATFTANSEDWTKGTLKFAGTGIVKVTIQDYFFCTPTVAYIRVVPNLIKNGSFEYGKLGWGARYNRIDTLGDEYITTTEVHSGSYAATATAYNYVSTVFNAKPNTDYVISFWVKSTGNMQFRLSDGATAEVPWDSVTAVNGMGNKEISAKSNWTKQTIRFNSGDITTGKIGVIFRGATSNGTIYVDDVEVIKNPYSDKLLLNGDLEAGNYGYDLSENWGGRYSYKGGLDGHNLIVDNESYDGKYSVKSTNGMGYVATYFTPEKNTDYTLTFYAKGGWSEVNVYSGAYQNCEIGSDAIPLAKHNFGSGDWKKITLPFNSGDAETITLSFRATTESPLYVDNVQVEKSTVE